MTEVSIAGMILWTKAGRLSMVRPKVDQREKKMKIALTIDPALFVYLRDDVANMSDWMNQAGLVKMNNSAQRRRDYDELKRRKEAKAKAAEHNDIGGE